MRKPKGPPLTHAHLLSVLVYEPETGDFRWRPRGDLRGRFTPGQKAGTSCRGYIFIELMSRRYNAARLAWFYQTGRWPHPEVDHRDGVGVNNAWENLREANRAGQMRNTRLSKRNKSGRKGVCWDASRGKWAAYIRADGPLLNLGRFASKDEAIAAREAAEQKLHGEYARAE